MQNSTEDRSRRYYLLIPTFAMEVRSQQKENLLYKIQ